MVVCKLIFTFAAVKKVFLSILTLLYMTVSSGMAMEIHYCMGKKAGMDIYKTAGQKCGRCGMKEKKGCCSDEHKFLKLEDAHKNVSADQFIPHDIAVVPAVYNVFSIPVLRLAASAGDLIHGPPPDTGEPLYLLNRVFRI
jgi:hypothetical protein